MSDTRRIIPVTLDVEASARRVVVGTSLEPPDSSQAMHLYYGTQLLFRATLLSGAVTTSYQPAADAVYLFGIDDRYDADHADLVVSDDSLFNIAGDWADLEPTAGKITFRADLATTNLKNALAAHTAAYKTMYCYVWILGADGNVLIATWPVTMWRVAVDPTTAVPVQGLTHLSTQAAAERYVPRLGDQARWRWNGTGWDYLFEEDSKYREMLPQLVDGKPVITWSDPKES